MLRTMVRLTIATILFAVAQRSSADVLVDEFFISAQCKIADRELTVARRIVVDETESIRTYMQRSDLDWQDRSRAMEQQRAVEAYAESIESALPILDRIRSICTRAVAGTRSHDQWLESFSALLPRLRKALDPCDSVYHCKRVIASGGGAAPKALPRGFQTYTLFLITSSEWLSEEKKKDLASLKSAYLSFADSIGEKRAAIWFSSSSRSDKPDIERSKWYSDLLGLNYNDGPYVITFSHHPSDLTKGSEIVVIRLSDLTASRAIRVLNILEQDLRTDARVRMRALLFEELKQRLFSIADRSPEIAKGVVSLVSK